MSVRTSYERGGSFELVTVKVVSSPRRRFIGRYQETVLRTVYVTFPQVVDAQEVAHAAHEMFDQHCQHSCDCCGHWYCSASTHRVKKVSGRTWRVPLSYSRNV